MNCVWNGKSGGEVLSKILIHFVMRDSNRYYKKTFRYMCAKGWCVGVPGISSSTLFGVHSSMVEELTRTTTIYIGGIQCNFNEKPILSWTLDGLLKHKPVLNSIQLSKMKLLSFEKVRTRQASWNVLLALKQCQLFCQMQPLLHSQHFCKCL